MPRKSVIGLVGSLALWILGLLGSFTLLHQHSAPANTAFESSAPRGLVYGVHTSQR